MAEAVKETQKAQKKADRIVSKPKKTKNTEDLTALAEDLENRL